MTERKEQKGPEIRTAAGGQVEFRAEGDSVKVAGYAAVFNEWTNIADYWQERIAPGAFDKVLGDDVRFLVNHTGLPLARTKSGTLKLTADERGLYVEANLDMADPDVAALAPKLRRGDVGEMSFAFRSGVEEWDESGDMPRRTIKEFSELRDVSAVTHPAYEGTEIGLRSLEAARAEAEARGAEGREAVARRMRMQLRLVDAG